MTQEQLTDLREQRERLAQQLKELDAEIKTTETEVYKTLVLSDDSAFTELSNAYQEHDFKTKVEMTPEGLLTCTMETKDYPKLTFIYTHKKPVATPKQCAQIRGILMDYLPCIVRLLELDIPRGTYRIAHTTAKGVISGRANVNGCHLRLDVNIEHSNRTGSRRQPSKMTEMALLTALRNYDAKDSFYACVGLDNDKYDLSLHVRGVDCKPKLHQNITLTRRIYNREHAFATSLNISTKDFQKELAQFVSKAKSLANEPGLW